MKQRQMLSNGEFDIMESVWKAEKPLTQTEIMRRVNGKTGKQLKVAIVATYLQRIMWKGYLEKSDNHDGHPTYHALVSIEEYYKEELRRFIARWGKKEERSCTN